MKKLILPIFFVFLLLATSASVFAKDPECWTKHMVRQMADCSKAFLECNNPCGAILDENTRYGCFDSCSKASTLCREKASADYRACVATGIQAPKQSESKQLQPSVESTQEPTLIQQTPPLSSQSDFMFVLPDIDSINDIIFITYLDSDIKSGQPSVPPKISLGPEGKPRFTGEYSHYGSKVQYQDNWRRLQTEKIISVTEPTLFELTDNRTLIGLSPGQGNQVAVKIPKDGKSYLLFLEEGEVEIVKNKPGVSDSEYDGIKTPNATVVSVQTHYLVQFDKKTNQTTVTVYEGKVEVKTKDGKTIKVSPNGDKPGVVVVSQKLSVTKLTIVGLLITAVIGGVVLILKRKFTSKGFIKKKR